MSDVCFVFPSTAEKDANKIIDKYLKNVEYDVKYLHNQEIQIQVLFPYS